jgi:hypothetical protein
MPAAIYGHCAISGADTGILWCKAGSEKLPGEWEDDKNLKVDFVSYYIWS